MRRKSSQNITEDDKKDKYIKLSSYVPEGEINPFITELITHAVESLIYEIGRGITLADKKKEGLFEES